jgi:hypothetical protein
MIRKGLITCALAGLLTAGTAFAKVHFYVNVGPPAAVVETRPIAPGPGYVWTPGYYHWNGNSYVWLNGAWAHPPHHHHRYVAGVWVHGHRGWYYRNGYWR